MNSNILDVVLKIKPSLWDDDDYSHKIFSRKNVSPSSQEYADVLTAFIGLREVKKIERAQNPFLYGKYIIRKEQLTKRGENVREVKCYISVKIEDIDSALEYNCDPRFVNNRDLYLPREKPTFYLDPHSLPISENTAIIVLSALLTTNEYSSFTKSTDTEYYPQYIVFF